MKKITLLFAFIAILFGANAQKLEYTLDMPNPNTHYFEVGMNIQDLKQDYIDIKMPVWAPGSYLIREFGKSVEDVSATASGKEVKVQKINKNTWRIHSKKDKNVSIKYKVYAFELSVRTSYLDMSHGYVNGTSVFMFIKDKINLNGTLKVTPYKDFKKINTGLPKVNGNDWVRSFSDYDVLVDSPIEVGNQYEFTFDAAGCKHTVAMFGESNFDEEKLKVDMAKIVETTTDIFGFNPNKEYTFIIHNLTNGSGGLEHLNSTTLQVNRWTYSGKAYLGFLSLVAHEYFHLWNVKRIRPIELGPFDYENENYTSLLWIMEGFTSYYDELILQRAGFYTNDNYHNILAKTISRVENQPGNRVLPVADASLDAWVKLYRPNENSYNTSISYYSKGSLVALVLDLEIINATKGEKDLDDVLIYLYKTYYEKEKRGFTKEEAKAAIEKVAGKNLDDIFDNYIHGTETIDYQKYLGYVGKKLVDTKAGSTKPSLGVRTSSESGKVVISSITRNTSAYSSELSAKDEIIAINGHRVSSSSLGKLIGMYKVGETIDVLISRDGIISTIMVELKADPSVSYKIKNSSKVEKQNQTNFNQWMH